ncbi:MAG: corrinoid protein [Ardenticatenaceae bacterium]|nr:corrinoid protein [Ardenticatenaceae bacterium]
MDNQLVTSVSDLEENRVRDLVQEELDKGENPLTILDACRRGMEAVGQRFQEGEYFLSDLIMAGEIFKQVSGLLTPALQARPATNGTSKGRVVIGTVKGDIHDIGKDIIVTMLRGTNHEVFDLGVDVPPERFIETLRETGARVLGLSGLLTTSFDPMKETVTALEAAGLRPDVKVIIGGGPVTEKVREYTGADAWTLDAQGAISLCDQWLEVK